MLLKCKQLKIANYSLSTFNSIEIIQYPNFNSIEMYAEVRASRAHGNLIKWGRLWVGLRRRRLQQFVDAHLVQLGQILEYGTFEEILAFRNLW